MYKSRGKTSTQILTNRCNEPGELLRNIAYKNTHFTLIFHVLTKRYFLIKAKKKKKNSKTLLCQFSKDHQLEEKWCVRLETINYRRSFDKNQNGTI